MTLLLNALRQAARRFQRQPLLPLAGVVTLAVGIGSCATVLAFFQAAVLRPAAFVERDRLIDVQATRGRGAGDRFALYPADLVAWRQATTAFESLGGYSPVGTVTLAGAGEPQRLRAHRITADFFPTLRIEPMLGRAFGPEDAVAGAAPVALLSHPTWQHRFGGDPAVVGRSLRLDGRAHTVLGVMPSGFGVRGGIPDVWLPLVLGAEAAVDRRSAYLGAVGRLAPGTSIESAQQELAAVAARLAEENPDTLRGLRPSLLPLSELMTVGQAATVRWLLLVAALLLGAAIFNTAALAWVELASRRAETAVRLALGAGRQRLAASCWIETLPIVVAGTALGLLLASAVLGWLPELGGRIVYRSVEVAVDGWVIALSAAIGLGVWIVQGGVAALSVARGGRGRSGLPGSAGPGARTAGAPRSLGWLVVGQVAAAAVLLSATGLLLRSFDHLRSTDLGFDPGGALLLALDLPAERYPEGRDQTRLLADLLPRLAALPGVSAAAASTDPPGAGWGVQVWPGTGKESAGPSLAAGFQAITPRWIEAVGLPLRSGRDVSARDLSGAAPVVLLSRAAARSLFADRDAVGERIWLDPEGAFEVVGVVGDSLPDPLVAVRPMVYFPHPQLADVLAGSGRRELAIVVRAVAPAGRTAAVRTALSDVDPELSADVATLEARLGEALFRPRLTLAATLWFAVAAFVLAAVGLYGVLSFEVGRRRREIGIRMALGSTRGQVVRRVLRRSLVLAAAGCAIGLISTTLSGRLLAGLLHGVTPADPWTLGAVLSLLSLSAAAIACLPARRAANVDPAESLRAD